MALADMYDPRRMRARVPDRGMNQVPPGMPPGVPPAPPAAPDVPPAPPPFADPTNEDEWRQGFDRFANGYGGADWKAPEGISPDLLADYTHWADVRNQAFDRRRAAHIAKKQAPPPGAAVPPGLVGPGAPPPGGPPPPDARLDVGAGPRVTGLPGPPAPTPGNRARDIKNRAMPKKGKPKIVR